MFLKIINIFYLPFKNPHKNISLNHDMCIYECYYGFENVIVIYFLVYFKFQENNL
jgi:hypothetical protein